MKVVTWNGQGFNYSSICNYGAAQRDGDILLFLNNDTEIINNDWLTSMVGFFSRPEVGMVGAKLLFPDQLSTARRNLGLSRSSWLLQRTPFT